MNEKDLLKKLNNLKNICLASDWKENNRNILISQISSQISEDEDGFSLKLAPSYFFRFLMHPATVLSLLAVLIFGGGTVSVLASKNSKPGDSLYIAKKISERVRYSITFGEKEKTKLNIEFATNRAKEMAQVMAEVKPEEDKQDAINQLSDDFKKEITTVKEKIGKMSNQVNIQSKETAKEDIGEKKDEIFGANLGKDDKGMQITPNSNDKNEVINSDNLNIDLKIDKEQTSSTPEKIDTPKSIIDEAEKLFSEKDINGTINKLEEVNDAIKNSDGQVKGESEAATSTK